MNIINYINNHYSKLSNTSNYVFYLSKYNGMTQREIIIDLAKMYPFIASEIDSNGNLFCHHCFNCKYCVGCIDCSKCYECVKCVMLRCGKNKTNVDRSMR